ncbi:hypothetical protein [Gleimia europaea]|uniref:hypothetical protein n=1 Tax=Gleimia europaea TaxID=66228 RepID=UPI000C80C3EF|nr:hypothetical protein [Gleimia europaea]WIK62602.1 hypothetical protein CJ185_008815 [Gleimia europaea]
MQQLSIFDALDTPAPSKPQAAPHCDLDALADIALVYTTTEKANSTGIRFATSVDDAQKFCSDDRTRGVLHGTQWAFMWTKASTWIQVLSDAENPVIDLDGMTDDGSRDGLIAELGVSKIDLTEFPRVFGPLGVRVKNAPKRKAAR